MVNIVCNHKNKFYDAGVVINSLPVYNDLSTFIMYANAHLDDTNSQRKLAKCLKK